MNKDDLIKILLVTSNINLLIVGGEKIIEDGKLCKEFAPEASIIMRRGGTIPYPSEMVYYTPLSPTNPGKGYRLVNTRIEEVYPEAEIWDKFTKSYQERRPTFQNTPYNKVEVYRVSATVPVRLKAPEEIEYVGKQYKIKKTGTIGLADLLLTHSDDKTPAVYCQYLVGEAILNNNNLPTSLKAVYEPVALKAAPGQIWEIDGVRGQILSYPNNVWVFSTTNSNNISLWSTVGLQSFEKKLQELNAKFIG